MNELATPIDNQARVLPSGRSVVVRFADGQEQIEIRDPSGQVEVRIELTAAGPVVRLTGARLELQAAEEVAIQSKRVTVQTEEEIRLAAGGDVDIKGALVKLNC